MRSLLRGADTKWSPFHSIHDHGSIASVRLLHVQAGVGVLAPLAALEANPIANAVAVVSLEDVAKSGGQVNLPEGAIRFAVEIKVRLGRLLEPCLGFVILLPRLEQNFAKRLSPISGNDLSFRTYLVQVSPLH